MFNIKPKNGVAFWEKHGIITPDKAIGEDDTDEKRRTRAIAKFLKGSASSGSGRLDKKELGEYISRPDQVELLKAFIGLFDFSGVSPGP
jgi:brefeldin A-resistance guanine nucleotide exchange factor 1